MDIKLLLFIMFIALPIIFTGAGLLMYTITKLIIKDKSIKVKDIIKLLLTALLFIYLVVIILGTSIKLIKYLSILILE